MRRTPRVLIVAALGALAAAVAQLVDPGGPWSALVILGAAVVLGELFLLRPGGRAPLPLSFAFVMVLMRAASSADFALVLLGALALAFVLRPARSMTARIVTTASRLVGAAAALGAYLLVLELAPGTDEVGIVLLALGVAGVVEIGVDDGTRMLRARRFSWSIDGRLADLALVTSGMLMSVAYRGADGTEGMGLWAPLLFSIPLLAAWYSYERLASIRRTHEQTIAALSVVPELAGLARSGHAERVADLSVALGDDLGLGRHELEYLRTAALLHHLGHLCLDDPAVRGLPIQPSEVSDKGAEILRQTGYLSPAGDLLASDSASLGGQILRVASAFDELSAGDAAFADAAVEALYSGPGYVYDARVLDALERVVIGTAVPARG